MAIINYNLRQITNKDVSVLDEETFSLRNKTGNIQEILGQKYFVFTSFHFGDVEGVNYGEGGMPLIKFGYICEPNAFAIPIYIGFKDHGELQKINIGKTGMYEIQTEELVNKETDEVDETLIFYIDTVLVPVGFNFSIDYIIPAPASN